MQVELLSIKLTALTLYSNLKLKTKNAEKNRALSSTLSSFCNTPALVGGLEYFFIPRIEVGWILGGGIGEKLWFKLQGLEDRETSDTIT